MEDWRHPLSAVIVFVVGLAVCAGILLVASPREEDNVRIHLTPRYHTVKRHINKYSHILEETQIGLPGMREGYKRRRQKVEKGVIHLKSRGAILKDYLPSGKPTEKYKSLRGDGEGFNLSFKSCAVVHSSGIMANSSLGSVIDSYDGVFRLDADPTSGHEDDVGEKTSVRVVAPNSISEIDVKRELLQNETLVFYGSEHIFSLGLAPKVIFNISSSYPDMAVYRMTDGFEMAANSLFELHTNIKRRKVEMEFSSAFHAVLLMMDVCQESHLYGFIPNEYCLDSRLSQLASYKYYHQRKEDLTECEVYQALAEMGSNRPFKEREVIKDLQEEGKVTVKKPLWT